jgi:hypothetical protein
VTVDAKPYEDAMRELIGSGDTEDAHAEADRLLVALLEQLGYGDLCRLYERVDKWFA